MTVINFNNQFEAIHLKRQNQENNVAKSVIENTFPIADSNFKTKALASSTYSAKQEFNISVEQLSLVDQFKKEDNQVFSMLAESFPNVPEETVAEVLVAANDDFVLAAEELSELNLFV